jgi:hypothetical protein
MMTTRKKLLTVLTIVLVFVSLSAASIIPGVEAGYARRKRTDSWGDSIQITANYNIGGGHVDYQSRAGKYGVKISDSGIGFTIGYYIARIQRVYVYLKCYNSAGVVIKRYSRTYYMKSGSHTKTVSVPSGTVRIYARMSTRFVLLSARLGFPTRTLSLSLYA